jgi:hypothetical protein
MLIMTGLVFSQNLIYTSQTWTNGAISDTLDLGTDSDLVFSDYGSTEQETRVIGLWFDGTWTNTSFTVQACTSLTGTFDAVTDKDGTALTITMASNKWVYLNPQTWAGLRYIRLVGSAEGGARTLVIIRRRY